MVVDLVPVKIKVMAVKPMVVLVEVVFTEYFALSDECHFAERPSQALPRLLAEVKSRGYFLDPYFLRSCKPFHFA